MAGITLGFYLGPEKKWLSGCVLHGEPIDDLR